MGGFAHSPSLSRFSFLLQYGRFGRCTPFVVRLCSVSRCPGNRPAVDVDHPLLSSHVSPPVNEVDCSQADEEDALEAEVRTADLV